MINVVGYKIDQILKSLSIQMETLPIVIRLKSFCVFKI